MDEQGDAEQGAQEESAAEREFKRNPANQQDLGRPPAGRDEPPERNEQKGKRSPDSPWMGGG